MVRTANNDHMPSILGVFLRYGNGDWGSHVRKARSYRADDRDESIPFELWQMRVIVLEDAERERETYGGLSAYRPDPEAHARFTHPTTTLQTRRPQAVASMLPIHRRRVEEQLHGFLPTAPLLDLLLGDAFPKSLEP